ncbi:hypothetical protein [Mobiluncus curtisii]|uniref:Uncharacterized protein n=2 Tax=Mobiluncus curtisii TaxID=2051 RepID=D6ZKJ7_MOBCV|nr:hypothetical protein [Mobiluncus curtisii]ADI67246.1 hypothetical protein HMPREF0573_10927 [Mobiluncus curtisii ATCC 43063]NMW45665.1 hypothetical protein [Mobiluncus curtisii]NMW99351.1 hypothetical protein [Mobiluncus curtisii]QQU08997.1 hypothetical protein I6I85_02175 [Mobiluncus curtisii]SQB65595.1 Uncharacterised protein [Mobiluncus curtisii]
MRSLRKKSLVAGIAAIALVALSGCEMNVKLKVIDEHTIEPSVIVAMSEAEKDMLSSMGDGGKVTCQDLADTENEGEATVKDLSTGGDMKCEIILPQEQSLNSSKNLKKDGDDLVLTLPKEDIDDLKSKLNGAGDTSEIGMDSITMNLIIQMPHGIKTATVDGQPVDFQGDSVTLDLTDLGSEVKVVSSPDIPAGNSVDTADSKYDSDSDHTAAGITRTSVPGYFLLAIPLFSILIVAGIVILIVVLVKKSKAKANPVTQFGQPMNYGQPGQPQFGQPTQPQPFAQPGQPQPFMQPGQPAPTQSFAQPSAGQPAVQTSQPQFGQPNPFAQPGQPTQMANPFAQPAQPGQPVQTQFEQQNQPDQTQLGQPQSFGSNIPDQAGPSPEPTDSTQNPNPQN